MVGHQFSRPVASEGPQACPSLAQNRIESAFTCIKDFGAQEGYCCRHFPVHCQLEPVGMRSLE